MCGTFLTPLRCVLWCCGHDHVEPLSQRLFALVTQLNPCHLDHLHPPQTFIYDQITIPAGTTFYAAENRGTVVGGDRNVSSLVITRGAQIYAEGTAAAPITFTSVLAQDGRLDTAFASNNVSMLQGTVCCKD